MSLILASASPFRQAILAKLGLTFATQPADVDESRQPNETPAELVQRLAQLKAKTVAKTHAGLIIGSDQVATLESGNHIDDAIFTKPLTHANAVVQLTQSAGKTVTFLTGLTLLNTETDQMQTIVDRFQVKFRPLTAAQIEHYLVAEQPYHCAGSFKSEGLGVALFERMTGDDPNSLVGLPLIQLIKMLARDGVDVLRPNI